MIKKIILFLVSLLTGVGLLVATLQFIGWQEIGSALLIFKGWQGIVILLLTALMILSGVCKWKVILKSQGYDLPERKLVGPYLAGFSLIYLFPVAIFAGETLKSYVLKENFSVPWKNGITSEIIDRILELTSYLVAIFAGSFFFFIKIGLPPQNIVIIWGSFLIIITAAVGFFYFKIFKSESLVEFFAKILNYKKINQGDILAAEKEIFDFFRYKKKALYQAVAWSFFRVAAAWLRAWLLVLFLGKAIGSLAALSILGFYYLVYLIPIPASLGSHELIQTFSFTALGLDAGSAPIFTMVQRGAELVLVFIGLAIFFRLGLELLRTFLFRRMENLLPK